VAGAPIDHPGDILAITTPIPDGQNTQVNIKFDTAEDWTNNRVILTAVNFFSVALHELGHAIGLDHSANPASTMYPINTDFFIARSELNTDDKDGASYLYTNVPTSDGTEIMIVNEAQYSVSWFAFNDYDTLRWTGLASGDLAGGEMYWYRPVSNRTGSYLIRFSHLGTKDYEYAGGIVKPQNNKVLISYQPVGTYGAQIEIAYES
jgi:matrixin